MSRMNGILMDEVYKEELGIDVCSELYFNGVVYESYMDVEKAAGRYYLLDPDDWSAWGEYCEEVRPLCETVVNDEMVLGLKAVGFEPETFDFDDAWGLYAWNFELHWKEVEEFVRDEIYSTDEYWFCNDELFRRYLPDEEDVWAEHDEEVARLERLAERERPEDRSLEIMTELVRVVDERSKRGLPGFACPTLSLDDVLDEISEFEEREIEALGFGSSLEERSDVPRNGRHAARIKKVFVARRRARRVLSDAPRRNKVAKCARYGMPRSYSHGKISRDGSTQKRVRTNAEIPAKGRGYKKGFRLPKPKT